jgi:hypothetical protein
VPNQTDVVAALLAQRRFASVRAITPLLDLPDGVRTRVLRLTDAGDRLLDLDAEDFEAVGAEVGVPPDVVDEIKSATFPHQPRAENRGSLRSLAPLYALMLETLTARIVRNEPLRVVSLLHLMTEYLPLLAWESTLGHAGDPAQLLPVVTVAGSRWGNQLPGCYHTSSQRSAAERVLHVGSADDDWWEAYLNRFHSRTAEAMGRCATHPTPGRPTLQGMCLQPCAMWEQFPAQVKASVGARVHLGRLFAESSVIELRHHAPVGHYFGVPSLEEVDQAWRGTWRKLVRSWADTANPLPELSDEPPKLPQGVAAIVSAVAGRDISPCGVLSSVCDLILSALRSAELST